MKTDIISNEYWILKIKKMPNKMSFLYRHIIIPVNGILAWHYEVGVAIQIFHQMVSIEPDFEVHQ